MAARKYVGSERALKAGSIVAPRSAIIPQKTMLTCLALVASLLLLCGSVRAQSSGPSYVYDSLGRLVAVYDSSGNAAVYQYDAVGNLLGIVDHASNQLDAFYLSSSYSAPGSSITIYGTDFCSSPTVTFNQVSATVTSATTTQISVTVPSGGTSGPVVVTCGSTSTTAGSFGSGVLPTISSFSPTDGPPGTAVTITGTNEQGVTNVLFNGTPALVTSTTSTTVSVVVPSQATSGPIVVTNQYGQTTSSTDFNVLPPGTISSTQITLSGSATPIPFTFDAGGEQAVLTFSGTAGQEVLFSLSAIQLDCSAKATVLNPDGSTLTSIGMCSGSPYGTAILPSTGVYSFVLNDGYDSGSVDVAIQDVSQLPTISAGGSAVPVTIPPNQSYSLVFAGTAGEQVSLSATLPSNTTAGISVIGPDGSTETWAEPVQASSPQYIYEANEITLPATGMYVIYNSTGSSSASYDVQLYNSPTIFDTATIGGPAVTDNTTVPGQAVDVSFNGTAGQIVSFGMVSSSSYLSNTNCATLISPDGTQTATGGTCYQRDSVYTQTFSLATTGVYHLQMNSALPTTLNTTVYNAAPVSGTTTIEGPAVSVSFNPDQVHELSFSGTSGQQISIGVANSTYVTSGSIEARITNPDGTQSLPSSILLGAAADSGAFSLPQTGTYVLNLIGTDFQPGTADVTLYDATPVTGSISIGGSSVAMGTNPGQPLELTFSGKSGQQVLVRVSNMTYGSVAVTVYNPDGTTLTSGTMQLAGIGGTLVTPALPTHGTYTLQLIGTPNDGSATVSLSNDKVTGKP